jgi:hypothetical protein
MWSYNRSTSQFVKAYDDWRLVRFVMTQLNGVSNLGMPYTIVFTAEQTEGVMIAHLTLTGGSGGSDWLCAALVRGVWVSASLRSQLMSFS